MSAPPNAKKELLELVETLSNEDAERFLDHINMCLDPDELSPEEEEAVRKATEEFERGETISGEDLKRALGIEL